MYNNLINGMLKREKYFFLCFSLFLIFFMKIYVIRYGCYGWCRFFNILCMFDLYMCFECFVDIKLRLIELICFFNFGLSVLCLLKLRLIELIWSLI